MAENKLSLGEQNRYKHFVGIHVPSVLMGILTNWTLQSPQQPTEFVEELGAAFLSSCN